MEKDFRVTQQVENFEDKEFQGFLKENKISSEESYRYKCKDAYTFKGKKEALLALSSKYFGISGAMAESWVHQPQPKPKPKR